MPLNNEADEIQINYMLTIVSLVEIDNFLSYLQETDICRYVSNLT